MFPEWLDLTFNRYLSKPDDLYAGKIFGPEKVAPSEFFGATDKFNEHNHNKIKAKYSTERQAKTIENAVFKSLYGLLNDELLDFIEKVKTNDRRTNYINNWSITINNFSTYDTYSYSDNLFSLTTSNNITTSSSQIFRTYARVSNDSLSNRMITYTQSYSDNITISVSNNGLTTDTTAITWTQPKITLGEITNSSKKVPRIKRIMNREYEIKEDLIGYNLKPVKTYYTCPFCGSELKSVISDCETCKEAEIRKRRKTIQYFTQAERVAVKRTFKEQNCLSLRDKAIGCLLYYTGLRCSDISNLKFSDINWEKEEVSIIQQKTGVPLRLPLTAIVGNAIYDYVVKERGDSDCEYIFLSKNYPFGKITSSAVGQRSAVILKEAGIRQNPGDRKGGHIFRHNFATSMLEKGVPKADISHALGHSSPDSTDAYFSADMVHLKALAQLLLVQKNIPVAEIKNHQIKEIMSVVI